MNYQFIRNKSFNQKLYLRKWFYPFFYYLYILNKNFMRKLITFLQNHLRKYFVSGQFNETKFNYSFYMENKEKIDKVSEIADLIEKSLKTNITYDEFNRLKYLLNELKIVSDNEFNKKVIDLNFKNVDDIFNAIKKYRTEEPVVRVKINDFLGSLSGATTTTQINIIKDYKRSKEK